MTTLDLTVFDNCVNFVLCGLLSCILVHILFSLLISIGWYITDRLELRRFKAKVKTKFNMSDFNLKPCPFCGSEHIRVDNNKPFKFLKFENVSIECGACGISTGYTSPQYAVLVWNNRATDTTFSTATADDINN